MPISTPQIIPSPRQLRPEALRKLHDALTPELRTVLTQALDKLDRADERVWDGLFIAAGRDATSQRDAVDGVIWVQRAAGNTAVVWASPEEGEGSEALLRAAADFIDTQRIPLAQMVVGEQDGYSEATLDRGGLPRFAALLYLFAEVPQLHVAKDAIASPPIEVQHAGDLQFVPRAGDQPQRLGQLLEQTYVGTLDCPALDGIRPMHEVLEGYRAQGRHSPNDWYFVQKNGVDVGALILAEHPGFGNWELVYMGVIPAARGQKCGEKMIQFALEVAGRRGAERLVLAVDEVNTPALRAYERAGFVVWDRRLVYARLRTPAQHSANVELPRA